MKKFLTGRLRNHRCRDDERKHPDAEKGCFVFWYHVVRRRTLKCYFWYKVRKMQEKNLWKSFYTRHLWLKGLKSQVSCNNKFHSTFTNLYKFLTWNIFEPSTPMSNWILKGLSDLPTRREKTMRNSRFLSDVEYSLIRQNIVESGFIRILSDSSWFKKIERIMFSFAQSMFSFAHRLLKLALE